MQISHHISIIRNLVWLPFSIHLINLPYNRNSILFPLQQKLLSIFSVLNFFFFSFRRIDTLRTIDNSWNIANNNKRRITTTVPKTKFRRIRSNEEENDCNGQSRAEGKQCWMNKKNGIVYKALLYSCAMKIHPNQLKRYVTNACDKTAVLLLFMRYAVVYCR